MKTKLLMVFAASFFIAGCFHQTTTPAPSQESQVEQESAMENGESMMEEVTEITVDGSEFKFEPSTIIVAEGSKVRLTFRNVGQMTHDWRLDEFSAATDILSPGGEQTIEFVADTAGEFEYYCSVNTHRQMGMVGTLVVE